MLGPEAGLRVRGREKVRLTPFRPKRGGLFRPVPGLDIFASDPALTCWAMIFRPYRGSAS
jgi:hypothetical protein